MRIRAALRHSRSEKDGGEADPLESHFAVIALGTLGEKELNYSSDIDLMFLYSGYTDVGEQITAINGLIHHQLRTS